jgi:hypothetical protein
MISDARSIHGRQQPSAAGSPHDIRLKKIVDIGRQHGTDLRINDRLAAFPV